MEDQLVAARVPKELKEEIDQAIKKGLYLNLSDLVRAAIRELLKGKTQPGDKKEA